MAMAGTAMPDVPAMTLGLVGLERTLAFRASRRTSQGVSVAVAFAAAILIRSHTVMLLPVAATLLVGAELRSGLRAVDARRLWPLGAAVLVAAAVAWITRDAQSGTMNFATSAAQHSAASTVVTWMSDPSSPLFVASSEVRASYPYAELWTKVVTTAETSLLQVAAPSYARAMPCSCAEPVSPARAPRTRGKGFHVVGVPRQPRDLLAEARGFESLDPVKAQRACKGYNGTSRRRHKFF